MKTYLANSVWLDCVPKEHGAKNGSRQFTILIRAKSKKDVIKILNVSPYLANEIYGLHDVGDQDSVGFNGEHKFKDIIKKDNTIYYHVEHTINGYLNQWFEYKA